MTQTGLDNGFFSFMLCKECRHVRTVNEEGYCTTCVTDMLRWDA